MSLTKFFPIKYCKWSESGFWISKEYVTGCRMKEKQIKMFIDEGEKKRERLDELEGR